MYKYIFQIYITTIQYAFRVFFDMRYLFLLARMIMPEMPGMLGYAGI